MAKKQTSKTAPVKRPGRGEVTYVPLATDPSGDFLAAMAYLAVLAFPTNTAARDKFVEAAKAYIAKCAIRAGAVPRAKLHRRYTSFSERRIWETGPIRKAAALITRRRMPAAFAAYALLAAEASRGSALTVSLAANGVPISSVNSAAVAFSTSRERGRDENWIARAWSETKPVLHLACALHSHVQSRAERCDLFDLLRYPAWARETLAAAETLRAALPRVSAVRFDPVSAVALLPHPTARIRTL